MSLAEKQAQTKIIKWKKKENKVKKERRQIESENYWFIKEETEKLLLIKYDDNHLFNIGIFIDSPKYIFVVIKNSENQWWP